MNSLIEKVEKWFIDRGLDKADPITQMQETIKYLDKETNMMWRISRTFENWVVSENGDVIGLSFVDKNGRRRKHRIMTKRINNDGYEEVATTINGETKIVRVHREVAMCFLENKENKETVNHIDGNKLNNHYSNLEWATRSEQMYHAYELELKKPHENQKLMAKIKMGKNVKAYSKESGETLYFLSTRDCSKHYGYSKKWADKIIGSQNGETRKFSLSYVDLEEVKNNVDKVTLQTKVDLVRYWFYERNLHKADPTKQMLKLFEEASEVASGMARNDINEIKDGIGDVLVVLIGLSMQLGISVEECLEIAYNEIKDRKGKLINGVFIKEEDLKKGVKNE